MNNVSYFVFDIGNVLFRYDPDYVLKQLFSNSQLGSFYSDFFLESDVWQQLDRGDISIEDVCCFFRTFYLLSEAQILDIVRIIDLFVIYLMPIKASIQWFHILNERFPVYLLTNFQDKPFDRLCLLYPWLKQANGVIVSSRVGFNKPEEDIYHCLFDAYDLDPEKGFFIDDRLENIQAAQALGLKGFCFEDECGFDSFMESSFQKYLI